MSFPVGRVCVFSELRIEKFLRKLAGISELGDALKKLDRLTQEEALMALAEVLKITHCVRDEVKVVDGKVERVENQVEVVGAIVEDIGDKMQIVIDGALDLPSQRLTF